ncbi:hypothetical protein PPL_00290 [Heterostelium album PN500]|uniref:NodB homology domain-containing protein n=1 Tax=Heterostelium pallidum (strain ATCC 26659 / Pp 5 / PN500) TaxID=670386 RepID=D3AW23_HETP5|nr:hypothetical protein PPL_00290 [Heterostelium album PN500]EFA86496.1 hypothetical protein PPL_00290 [Heterostelium album PN500]|eukprot:XP_020438601.1 hypothetical protein PPL_00290 [Heterostelium album PN500]
MIFIDDYPMNYKPLLQQQQHHNQNQYQQGQQSQQNQQNQHFQNTQITPLSIFSSGNSNLYNQHQHQNQYSSSNQQHSSSSQSSIFSNSNINSSNSLSNSGNSYYNTATNIYTRGRRPSIQTGGKSGVDEERFDSNNNNNNNNDAYKDDDDKKMNIYYSGGSGYSWWSILLMGVLALAIGFLLIVYFQPNFVVRALSNHFNGEVVFFSENRNEIRTRKLVALTIDDAPSRDTEAILDIFEQYNVKATFFLIGKHAMRSAYHQRVLDRVLDQGHEIGNHMWRDEPSINLELDEFERQLIQVDQIINQTYQKYYERLSLRQQLQDLKQREEEEVHQQEKQEQQPQQQNNQEDSTDSSTTSTTNLNTINNSNDNDNSNDNNNNVDCNNNNNNICNLRRKKLFRPGSGWFNRKMLDIVTRYGYTMCLGNVYPHDPFIKLTSLNSWYVTTTVSPGSVIILHDREYTADTLKSILPKLISEGYTFITLSNLLDIDEKLKQTELLNSNNNNNNNNNNNIDSDEDNLNKKAF